MRFAVLATAVAAALTPGTSADASVILARNARDVSLKINAKGTMALVTYRNAAGVDHVLAWGAVNARSPSRTLPQVRFKLDYSGGWRTFGRAYWKTFRDYSSPYDGPTLPRLVVAKKAPNGSYWALQAWPRRLPGFGVKPWLASQRAWELHLSHWTGDVAQLEIWTDWVYSKKWHHLFGRLTYRGVPVYGFGSTSNGNPTDAYGRNIYLDTYNSRFGTGWKRANGFLTHRPKGNFCYGFFPRRLPSWYPNAGTLRPPGNGERYRATVIGPGVTPVVTWTGPGLPDYDPANPEHVQHESDMNALGDSLIAGDPDDNCTAH